LSEIQINKLHSIIASILNIDADLVSLHTSPENTSEWDSFAHIAILTEVEEEFGLKFDFEEMFEINSVATLIEMLNNTLGF